MMGKYQASLNNFFFNSLNNVIVIIYGILLIPLYFKFMSLSTYGAWLASGNIVTMLGMVESGMASVVTQKMAFFLAKNDKEAFLKQAGANILSAGIFGAIILLSGISISPFIANWINVDSEDGRAITLAFIISTVATSIGVISSLLGAFPQVWQETKTVGFMSTITGVIGIVITISSLFLGLGVVSLALGILARALIHFCYITWIDIKIWNHKNLPKPVFSKEMFFSLTKACMYPFFSKLSTLLMNNSQNLIIATFMNPSVTAIYDLTNKICSCAANFVNVTNGSFFALFSLSYGSNSKENFNNVFNKVSFFFLLLLVSVVIYSFCFTEFFVSYWVGMDKFGGIILLLLLVLHTMFTQLKFFANNIMYSGGLVDNAAKLDIVAMFSYIGILFALIHFLRIFAVPLAGIISGCFFSIIYFYNIEKRMSVNLKGFKHNLFCFFAIIFLGIVVHVLIREYLTSFVSQIMYLAVFSISYVSLIFWLFKPYVGELVLMIKNKWK